MASQVSNLNNLEYLNSICKSEVRFLDNSVEINLYDCIYLNNNKSISNSSLKERVEICESIKSFLSDNFKNVANKELTFKVKPYFYSKNIKEMIKEVLQYMNSHYKEEKLTDKNSFNMFSKIKVDEDKKNIKQSDDINNEVRKIDLTKPTISLYSKINHIEKIDDNNKIQSGSGIEQKMKVTEISMSNKDLSEISVTKSQLKPVSNPFLKNMEANDLTNVGLFFSK